MEDKTRLITPFLMLTAGTIASIIMFVRKFEFSRMLWSLLIVLIIFYILGDVARYLYASVKPRIIPRGDLSKMVELAMQNGEITGNVVAFADGEEEVDGDRFMEEIGADGLMSDEEGYSDEELAGDDAEAEGEAADENE